MLKNIDQAMTRMKIGTRTESIDFPREIVFSTELADKTKIVKIGGSKPRVLSPLRVHRLLQKLTTK